MFALAPIQCSNDGPQPWPEAAADSSYIMGVQTAPGTRTRRLSVQRLGASPLQAVPEIPSNLAQELLHRVCCTSACTILLPDE